MPSRTVMATAAALSMAAGLAFAHGSEDHGTKTESARAPGLPADVSPLPWDVGGPFELTDHTGATRTQADPEGRYQLLFFGYANCPGICSAALPMMADVASTLTRQGIETTPVLVTIDPQLDTVETMGPALSEFSQDFVGLTGDNSSLDVAYKAFQVSFEKIFDDPEHGPIYSHGSHIYLLDPSGEVLTLLPPILSSDQAASIVARYTRG